jgi:hypothetical protein
MNLKSKSLFLCSFGLNKGNVARNTNSQVHRLHLATAPMGTLVTGIEYKLNELIKPKPNSFSVCLGKIKGYLIVVFCDCLQYPS